MIEMCLWVLVVRPHQDYYLNPPLLRLRVRTDDPLTPARWDIPHGLLAANETVAEGIPRIVFNASGIRARAGEEFHGLSSQVIQAPSRSIRSKHRIDLLCFALALEDQASFRAASPYDMALWVAVDGQPLMPVVPMVDRALAQFPLVRQALRQGV